jgi:2-iminobutanoate/2-iminopropanoate deaminase
MHSTGRLFTLLGITSILIFTTSCNSTPAPMKKVIFTPNAPKPIGPYSQAIQANGFVFVSGQIALHPVTGQMMQENLDQETRQVMANISSILTAAGLTFADVVKTSIFLKDMKDFNEVNKIYEESFKVDPPARETVQVTRLPKEAKVEISVTAVAK